MSQTFHFNQKVKMPDHVVDQDFKNLTTTERHMLRQGMELLRDRYESLSVRERASVKNAPSIDMRQAYRDLAKGWKANEMAAQELIDRLS